MTEPSLAVVGEYSRSRGGALVHWEPCHVRGKRAPWNFASRMSVHEVVALVASLFPSVRLCLKCWPKEALSTFNSAVGAEASS
jgi:hypothetical protein